jgi:hypothetical protein
VLLLTATVIVLVAAFPSRLLALSSPTTFSGSSSGSPAWNDFYQAPATTFTYLTGYRISFTYRLLAPKSSGDFYTVVNDKSQRGRTFAWQEWTATEGQTGAIHEEFIDRDHDKYVFVIGIHGSGKIEISNLRIYADPQIKPLNLIYPQPIRTWQAQKNVAYYIDSVRGNDQANGLSAAHPWRSLAKINSGILSSGNKVLLRSGSAWTGYLAPYGSGNQRSPITIKAYGSGPKPRINARGLSLATLYLSNSSYVVVQDLDISNKGRNPQPRLAGVEVSEDNVGTARQIVLDRLDIHDVTGDDVKSEGGGSGIDCTCNYDKVPTKFDGLLIENCNLNHVDRNGITMSGAYVRNAWYPSTHVIIRNNVLTDIGGDGIVPTACDGAIVEHNELDGGRMRALDYAAGIWPWSCDNTLIQYNTVSHMKGIKDGEAFDSDWNCRNSTFQYNYSHDNDGGFILVCNDGTTYFPYNGGNTDTVVRYNVSINDGQFTFYIAGPTSGTNIYNNTIYIGDGAARRLVQAGTWGGWPSGTNFINNVFYTTHRTGFDFGGMSSCEFVRNVFWGPFVHSPKNFHGITTNPRLLKVGGLNPRNYRPGINSPLLGAGATVLGDVEYDFDGASIPLNARPTIGAFQK